MRFAKLTVLALGLALASLSPAQAQYPNRPVTIMVSLAAGSGMDVLVRLYADKLSTILGKPVIVENRPGASLMLAANAVAQSQPDGHTLLVSTSSAMAINLTLFKQVTYDPDRDFIPVSLYVKSPFILVVNPDIPAKTVPELIKYIKENQGKLSYSSPGAGVAQHLSMEYMKNQFGLEITHVPYRSTPQSIQDIAAASPATTNPAATTAVKGRIHLSLPGPPRKWVNARSPAGLGLGGSYWPVTERRTGHAG